MQGKALKVVVCDDEDGRREQWNTRLKALLDPRCDVEILPLPPGPFIDQYNELLERRAMARKLRGRADEPVPLERLPERHERGATDFDTADILLVDYDLFRFREDEYLTGSVVAYLARCYSDCGVIVGVNEHGTNPFDLTLTDTPESFTDAIIGEAQLDNPLLWFGQDRGKHRYRPWYWPPLWDLPVRLNRLAQQCERRLDEHVIDFTGLAPVEKWLPRTAIGHLERAGNTAERTTLDDLARGVRLGLRRGDEGMSQLAVARIAATRAAKWVARVVLPLQDVLIDAPHLVSRNGALLEGEDVDAVARVPAQHDDLPLNAGLAKHAHVAPDWLPVPAYYWPFVASDRELPGVANPYDIPDRDVVFCEDLSSFLPSDQARRFVSRLVDSSSPTRWIADPEAVVIDGIEEVDYQPQSRLAL